MRVGMIYLHKQDIPKAQQAFEKVLVLSPRSALAANNLAWLYSEYGGDQEKALQLAQTAKEAAPSDPRISDTLGWILYKRGVYQRAVSLLKEAAAGLPDNPAIQYRLGLTSLKVGDQDGARQALTAALKSPASFPQREEAKKLLAELK
jgi:Tfp pilus assembly protein PilF